MENDLVTVIIPTYNRFKYLLNAIKSVKEQTYTNIEVLIVNDKSTEEEYYTFDFQKELGDNVNILHLEKNSKELYGFPSPGGHARNEGMKIAKGKYFAFLDDDDYFFPTKIEKQIKAMKEFNCQISCTDAMLGKGTYFKGIKCKKSYYCGSNWFPIKRKFTKFNKLDLLQEMFSKDINVWGKDELSVCNCTSGGSSIVIHRDIFKKAGGFPIMKYADDYAYWKKIVNYSNMLYLREHLTYLDKKHGSGINYKKK